MRSPSVTAGFSVKTHLGWRMRGGGLLEQRSRGHRVETSVMSSFTRFLGQF